MIGEEFLQEKPAKRKIWLKTDLLHVFTCQIKLNVDSFSEKIEMRQHAIVTMSIAKKLK